MFACLYVPPSPRDSGREPALSLSTVLALRFAQGVVSLSNHEAPRATVEGSGVEGPLAPGLAAIARSVSPRVEVHTGRLVTLDVSGLARLIGEGKEVAERLRRAAADHGILPVRVAIAGTRTAAILLARARVGITVVPAGHEASALSTLPLSTLAVLLELETGWRPRAGGRRPEAGSPSTTGDRPEEEGTLATRSQPEARSLKPEAGSLKPVAEGRQPPVASRQSPVASRQPPAASRQPDMVSTFFRWGLTTLGDLAALPSADLSERLGQQGIWWQRVARGEDAGPLVPTPDEEQFESTLELEWPIEGLEPLSFVLGRLLEPLCQRLERRDRGAAVLHIRLRLVTRETHARSLQLPAPMRDPRVLRTLLLLDLESHPAPAGIDAVTVAIDPTPGRIVQESLLTRALPTPEQMSTLLARLTALMGERRIGAPVVLDSHRPDGCALAPFRVPDEERVHTSGGRLAAGGGRPDHAVPMEVGSLDPTTGVRTGSPQRHAASGSPGLSTRPASDSGEVAGLGLQPPAASPQPPASGPKPLAPGLPASRQLLARRSAVGAEAAPAASRPCVALRRFRLPIAVSVVVDHGHPVSVRIDRQGLRGGRVESFAGPWRTSGEWWKVEGARGHEPSTVPGMGRGPGAGGWRPNHDCDHARKSAGEWRGSIEGLSPSTPPAASRQPPADHHVPWRGALGWNREEWEVALGDGGVYRIFEDRDLGRWFIEGILD